MDDSVSRWSGPRTRRRASKSLPRARRSLSPASGREPWSCNQPSSTESTFPRIGTNLRSRTCSRSVYACRGSRGRLSNTARRVPGAGPSKDTLSSMSSWRSLYSPRPATRKRRHSFARHSRSSDTCWERRPQYDRHDLQSRLCARPSGRDQRRLSITFIKAVQHGLRAADEMAQDPGP